MEAGPSAGRAKVRLGRGLRESWLAAHAHRFCCASGTGRSDTDRLLRVREPQLLLLLASEARARVSIHGLPCGERGQANDAESDARVGPGGRSASGGLRCACTVQPGGLEGGLPGGLQRCLSWHLCVLKRCFSWSCAPASSSQRAQVWRVRVSAAWCRARRPGTRSRPSRPKRKKKNMDGAKSANCELKPTIVNRFT